MSDKDVHKIRVADFSDPKPFKTVPGAMHSYTYVPFIGWLPPVELNLLIAFLAIDLAVALPQKTLGRKVAAFLLVPVCLACLAAVLVGLAYVVSWLNRRYFLLIGRARLTRRLKSADAETRRQTAWDLGYWGADAAGSVPALIEAARDPEKRVRSEAVEALGRIGPAAAQAVPVLIESLKDAEVSYDAAKSLGQIGAAALEAVPALTQALRSESDLTRAHAAEALGKIGPGAAEAVPALIAALDDSYYIARGDAAQALGELGSAAAPAVPALIRRLEDKETFWQMARALGRVGAGSKEAQAALSALLSHPDEKHREEAKSALERLKGEAGPRS